MGAAAPVIAIASTVIGAGVSAVGAIQEGKARQAQANYDAAISRNNAIIAKRAAADAIKKGEIAERQQRIKTAQEIARQRAGAAARSVEVDTGSAAALTEDTAGLGELDALTVRSNAEREALGFETDATNFTSQSDLLTAQGKNAARAGKLNAAGSILTGASSVASKWHTFGGSSDDKLFAPGRP